MLPKKGDSPGGGGGGGTLMSGTLLKSCFVPKRISLVLSGLISNLFVQNQEAISRRSSETFARQESMFSDEHER